MLAGVVAAAALALAPAAHAAKPLGAQIDSVTASTPQARIANQVAAASAVHANTLRVEVDWSALEPHAQGAYDPDYLAKLDRTIQGAAQRGIKSLVFLDRSPCWASSAPRKPDCAARGSNTFEVTRYGPTDPQTYVQAATFLATRYGAALAAFEIWNEPDQSNEKYWAGPDKVKRYVALMKAVYAPLKQANPLLPVLAGSFVGTNGAWLKAMYAAGAKGSYDGLAVHFYDLPLLALKTTHAVQTANGDDKPLWLTEFGWTSCLRKGGPKFLADHPCVTLAQQARGVADVYRAVARTPWIAGATMYMLRDQSTAYQFGLLDRADKRKPSFTAARRALLHPRTGALTRPTARLRRSGRHLVLSGTGSVADMYVVRAYQGTTLRYRATLRTTGSGTYRLALPSVLGTSGLKVRIQSDWTGRSVTRRS
ncbi:hypothetical protein DSM104299_04741 [Baekduia alba]|nr:hypothetical protein DSM104299_04741 [Baekduia alba]